MAKRKTKKKAPKKAKHILPAGFWRQVSAVLLIVLSLLLIVAMFDAGGPVLAWVLGLSLATIGWTTFILPILLIFIAVEIFRADENKLPFVVGFATLLLIAWTSAFLHLFIEEPQEMEVAVTGTGGGFVGWVVDQAFLSMLSPAVAGVVLAVLIVVTILFVLRISPSTLLGAIKELFGREEDFENKKIAATMKSAAKSDEIKHAAPKPVGELKLNEGVPTLQSDDATKRSQSKLSSLKGSLSRDKAAEEQTALTTFTDPNWEVPSIDLLEKKQSPADAGDVKHNAQIIKDTLSEFNIEVEMEGANIGPKVTQYTLRPPSGVRLTRITQLETNIALNLAAQSLRIEAPIPGQKAVGIEVPNRKAADVRLYGILSDNRWQRQREPLSFAIGKDIAGEADVRAASAWAAMGALLSDAVLPTALWPMVRAGVGKGEGRAQKEDAGPGFPDPAPFRVRS